MNRRKFIVVGLVATVLEFLTGKILGKSRAEPNLFAQPDGPFWWKVPCSLGSYEEVDVDGRISSDVSNKQCEVLVFAKMNSDGEPDYQEIWRVMALLVKKIGSKGFHQDNFQLDITDDATILPVRPGEKLPRRFIRQADVVMDLTQPEKISIIKNLYGGPTTISRTRCA